MIGLVAMPPLPVHSRLEGVGVKMVVFKWLHGQRRRGWA